MYTTGDILLRIPEIPRRILYNWVDRGYLAPIHTPVGDRGYQKKEFSEADYLKIRLMWKLYIEQEKPPRVASLKADELLSQRYLLHLSVEETFQQTDSLSGVLRLSPAQPFEVIARVEAYQIDSCVVSVSFDSHYLSLETGELNQRLQLDVYDDVDVCWTFRAIQTTHNQPIYIHTNVRSGERVRVASVPVEIADISDIRRFQGFKPPRR